MKTIPAQMQTDLDNGVTTHCFAWKLTREDTTVMGFTDHDKDITFDSVTYEAATGLNATSVSQSTDLNVDDLDSIGALDSGKITESDIAKGLYDNAEVILYRVDWQDTSNRGILFQGLLGNVTRGKIEFKGEVRSLASVLNQPQGQLFQKTCNVDLFSAECGVNVGDDPDFEKSGTVDTVISRRLFTDVTAGIIALNGGWFTNGKVTWTSGSNNGIAVEVKTHTLPDSSQVWIELWDVMPNDIQIGDTYDIQVGCNKTIEICKSKFDNVINFRGFPRMPGPDKAITYATRKEQNDGTSYYNT